MARKFLLFAALTILATLTNALDPDEFIKESFDTLASVEAKCLALSNDLEALYYEDSEEKEKHKEDLNTCRKNLVEIAKKGAVFNAQKVDDVTKAEIIKRLRNIEEYFVFGEDLFKISSLWKNFDDGYVAEDIEDFEDSDILWSLKEIENGNLVTRTEDINEINYYWKHVADKVGVYTWENFFEFVKILQENAKEYDMNAAEFWYPSYSEKTLAELETVIKELKPFFEQLHAYSRYKLLNRYGPGVVKAHAPIPETLFQQIEDRLFTPESYYEEDFPFSSMNSVQNSVESLSGEEAVELVKKFYKSLGFDDFSEEYWKEHVVYAEDCDSGFSFEDSYPQNVSLTYCNKVYGSDFLNLFDYFTRMYSAVLQKDNLLLFWNDKTWVKTIGLAMRLDVHGLNYMEHAFGSDDSTEWTKTVNARLAFENIFYLVRKYVSIRVVTDLLNNKVEKEALNKHYWALLEEYAGVEPPIDRTEESLDLPYSFIHEVLEGEDYIRDFNSKVHGFEVYKAACHKAGHTGPLHHCDFHDDKNVGEAFKEILTTGITKPFNLAIEPLIPSYTSPSAEALLSYFEPTFDWIKQYNKKHNLTVGWEHSKKNLAEETLSNEEEAIKFVKDSSQTIYKHFDQIASDLFNKKSQDQEFESDYYGNTFWKVSKTAEAVAELTEMSKKAKQFDVTKFASKPLRKAISKLAQVADVFILGSDMENFVYNKQRLFNLSLDDDINKYKDISDDPVTVPYNPYILDVFRTSEDAAELKYYWDAWRETNGAFAKYMLLDIFKSFEKAAQELEISTTEFWFKHYSNDYLKKMEKVIDAVRPFYGQLHYYVYRQVFKKYSVDDFSMEGGSIPDHFIQQVLLQIWTNESIVEEHFPWDKLPPHEHGFDSKKYEPLKLYKDADEFYQSLGFAPLEESFWTERVKVEEGSAKDGNCHASVYDMTPKVYIKYCERVSFRKFLQAHGYLGRAHYAVEKKDLPAYYFDSYDFEYPVGEAVILSAASPKHAQKLGLFSDFDVTDQVLLNRLVRMAIHTMFNLHKYFVHTKVVAEYLAGDIEEKELGNSYWKYMITYAGIEPPNDRKDDSFDFPFEFYTDLEQNHQVRKFTSEVLGYRIYERLCKISGHEGDLNNCDFFGSVAAGDALKSMMKLGSELPRNTVLKRLLQDVSGLNGNALLSYYEPLNTWLTKFVGDDSVNRFDSYRQYLHAEYYV